MLVAAAVVAGLSGCGGGGGQVAQSPAVKYVARELGTAGEYSPTAMSINSSGEVLLSDGTVRKPDGSSRSLAQPRRDVYRINDAGWVAGVVGAIQSPVGLSLAGCWGPGGELHVLGELSDHKADEYEAVDVDSSGVAVGYVKWWNVDHAAYTALKWGSDGTASRLASPTGVSSQAWTIDDAGEIVGCVQSPTIGTRIARWSADGSITYTGTPVPYRASVVHMAVNNLGQAMICWADWTSDCCQSAVIGPNGSTTRLRLPDGCQSAEACDINDLGQVAGMGVDTTSPFGFLAAAVIWDQSGTPVHLDSAGICRYSEAYGIDNEGQVVGCRCTAQGSSAVIWKPDGPVGGK